MTDVVDFARSPLKQGILANPTTIPLAIQSTSLGERSRSQPRERVLQRGLRSVESHDDFDNQLSGDNYSGCDE